KMCVTVRHCFDQDKLLIEGGVHHFDILRSLSGSNAKSVYTLGWNPRRFRNFLKRVLTLMLRKNLDNTSSNPNMHGVFLNLQIFAAFGIMAPIREPTNIMRCERAIIEFRDGKPFSYSLVIA